jgi:hypothetical protein
MLQCNLESATANKIITKIMKTVRYPLTATAAEAPAAPATAPAPLTAGGVHAAASDPRDLVTEG